MSRVQVQSPASYWRNIVNGAAVAAKLTRAIIGGVYNPLTDAEDSAGFENADITDFGEPEWSVIRYGCLRNGSDNATLLNTLCAASKYQWFRRGQYSTASTITRGAFSRWVGEIPQSSYQGGGDHAPEVYLYGTEADLTDGVPLVRLNAVNTAGQAHVTENMAFVSDLDVDTGDLSTVPSTGVIGVDVSHSKEGTEFTQVAFRALRTGVSQGDTDPYLDKLTFDRCHFMQCRLAVSAAPSAGIDLVNCFINDCYDAIDAPGADVSLVNSRLNNSSYASNSSQISARRISWNGGYCEGFNNVLNPSESATCINVYFSEMFSDSGSTKFVARPQGNNVTLVFIGCRIPTNTRMINFDDVTDVSTITVICIGCSGGSNFGNTSDINSYLNSGLKYMGWGNSQTDWNTGPQDTSFRQNRRNAQNATYTLTIRDAWSWVFHSSGSAHTWTIPAEASLNFPVGTEVVLYNESGGGNVTLAITTDTLRFGASTGSRTIAANGYARVKKVASGVWRILDYANVT